MNREIGAYKLVKDFNSEVKIGDFTFNGKDKLVIAGPCSIESYEQMFAIASFLKENNVDFIRACAFKPRTSPYSFQGLHEEGFNIVNELKKKVDIKIVSELTDLKDLDYYIENVDVIQVGARSMQNFALLEALGKTNKPIILKRGFANTIDEWLYACEYILQGGNKNVILCERGIKTFETMTRNTLDISSIPLVKSITKLPIIVDPSHASGRSDLVIPLSLASIAAGADGILVEIHPHPAESISDSEQALSFIQFKKLKEKMKRIQEALDN